MIHTKQSLNQINLFQPSSSPEENENNAMSSRNSKPLAFSSRPTNLNHFYGQEHIWSKHPFLKEKNLPSLILWGPPGSGKTTLSHILANSSHQKLFHFNAVLGGVNDLKKIIQQTQDLKSFHHKDSIIFIDEIHRFNKAQQDALLPYVEKGEFTLIGATTENPKVSVNRALISRLHLVELKKLENEDIFKIVSHINTKEEFNFENKILKLISDSSGGDARMALNILESCSYSSFDSENSLEELQERILEQSRQYDKSGDRHYDVISAFIKSMRGSDPDAALLWLAVMLDGGEDPVFIARRLIIFASEDIGNADPTALILSTSTLEAVKNIGMPEARINLAQTTTYLASTEKSNASYNGINEAMEYVKNHSTITVPDHLKNSPPKNSKAYEYPHAFSYPFSKQNYSSEKLPNFYQPKNFGREKALKERLEYLKNLN